MTDSRDNLATVEEAFGQLDIHRVDGKVDDGTVAAYVKDGVEVRSIHVR